MLKTLSYLFTPKSSNNYKAKALHISSLSIFMIVIMLSQIIMSFISKAIPGVLGIASNITAQELINLTNSQRAEYNLAPLQLNQTLVNAASLKASDMMAQNYWAHTSPGGATPWVFIKQAGYYYLNAGENLARDFGDSQSVVNAWMNSPTHRDNILSSRYHDIGIAVVHGTFQGQETTLVVQMFGTQVASALGKPSIQTPEIAVITAPQTDAIDTTFISSGAALAQTKPLGPNSSLLGLTNSIPLVNSFELTKTVSISLTLLLLAAIIVDVIVVTKQRIVRLSGKSLAHLVFLGILLILLLGIQPGLIL